MESHKRLRSSIPLVAHPAILSRTLVCLGILILLSEYARNRSLWLDEALLSLNILERSFSGLLSPLSYPQWAPVGYLLVEKFLVVLLGGSEYVLRLFPLLCGVASIVLFSRLVRRILDPLGAMIALGLFVVTDPLIYYASEAKPYSCDVTVSLLLLLQSIEFLEEAPSLRTAVTLGIAGALAVWFSYPAVFVLGACGVVLLLSVLHDRNSPRLAALGATFATWAVGTAACWQMSRRSLARNEFLELFWNAAFLPSPLAGRWICAVAADYLGFLDLTPWRPMLAALIPYGAASLLIHQRRFLLAASLTVGLTLAASYLHRYPVYQRFLLFWVPPTIVLVAAGSSLVLQTLGKLRAELPLVATVVLFAAPVVHTLKAIAEPRAIQELKPVLAHIKQHEVPGDTIYVFHLAAYPLKYYAARFGFDDEFPLPQSYYDPTLPAEYATTRRREFSKPGFSTIYLGSVSYFTSERLEDIQQDFEPLRGRKRVWVLLSHSLGGAQIGSLIVAYLNRIGTRLDSFERPGLWGGSEAYLYDLSRAPAAVPPGSS